MKQSIIITGSRWSEQDRVETYLGIQIINLVDSGVDVSSVDSLSDLHAQMDRLLYRRKLQVSFLSKPFSRSRITFADEIVHNDEINVPVQCNVSRGSKMPKDSIASDVEYEASFIDQITS
jgi:hypothetical protein